MGDPIYTLYIHVLSYKGKNIYPIYTLYIQRQKYSHDDLLFFLNDLEVHCVSDVLCQFELSVVEIFFLQFFFAAHGEFSTIFFANTNCSSPTFEIPPTK
jgi:hypothetical protein